MNKWSKLLLAFLMIMLVLPISAEEVKLLAYNVFFRPDPVGWFDYKEERFIEVSEAVRSYDVIGLCEVFDDSLRERWIKLLSDTHPHYINPPKRDWNRSDDRYIFNGGIMIFSRFPIVFHKKIVYTDGNQWDMFADKGAIFARMELPSGKTFEVVLTHAQAGGEYFKERESQFKEMQELVAENETGPTFLLGDFNVSDAKDEYNKMMDNFQHPRDLFRTLHKSPGYTSDGTENPLSGGESPKRIDYIFMKDPRNEVKVQECAVNKFAMKNPVEKALFMSDHYAVEATIKIESADSITNTSTLNMIRCDNGKNDFLASPQDINLNQLQTDFDPECDTIVMIHGFFNDYDSAKNSYENIHGILSQKIDKHNYVGFAWPCNIVLDFGKGIKHANKAGEHLSHVLSTISSWYGNSERKIHLMSSSLGNRVTFSMLKQNQSRFIKWGQCFNFCPGVHQDVYLNEFNGTNDIAQKNWVFYATNDFVLGYLYATYHWLFGRENLDSIPGYDAWKNLNGEEKIAKMKNLWDNKNRQDLSQFDQLVIDQIGLAQKNAMGLVGADLGMGVVGNVTNIEVTKMVDNHSYWQNPKVLDIVVNKLHTK